MYLLILLSWTVLCGADELTDSPAPCNCSHLLYSDESTEVYPTFPATSFTCWGRYDGYYADVEVDCTIFHYCQTWHFPTGLNETVKWDFACPQSTIFNQRILSCTQPNISFDCQESPNFYWVNQNYTFTTPVSSTTPETTTPNSNEGQQLIIGGISAQSAELEESPNFTTTTEFNESGSGYTPSHAEEMPEGVH